MPWHFRDPCPESELTDIPNVSIRAMSWLARASQSPNFPHDRVLQIAGGARILGGLDYHHHNFMELLRGLESFNLRKKAWFNNAIGKARNFGESPILQNEELRTVEMLNHEAIAYINRLGQFFTFARSHKVDAILRRASELMIFRHKHAAHRSIDAPRPDDTPHLQEVHAMSFNFHLMMEVSFPVFQIHDSNRVVTFHMNSDHEVVMKEAFAALQSIYLVSA